MFSKIAVKTRSLVHTINYGVIKVKRVTIYHLDFCAMSCPGPDIQSFTLSSILLRGEEVWNSLTKGSLRLSKGVFERG